ncbi:MAG: DoxX family protein [Aurantibacter sp.]
MKPLLVLLSVFIIGLLLRHFLKKQSISTSTIGKTAMASMLVFTGVAHFTFTEGMMAMFPNWVPMKEGLVYGTGILEVLGAVGLMLNKYSKITAICLILFLVLALPLNVYAALNYIDPQTGAVNGPGPNYLFFRIPLQLFFILWIYLSALKSGTVESNFESNPEK